MDCDQIVFSGHAVRRMFERAVAVADVVALIRSGEVIERYPQDQPLPSYLVFGFIDGEPLHVVVGVEEDDGRCVAVTVYRPSVELWDDDFRTRRM